MQTGYTYSAVQRFTDEGYVREEYTQAILDYILYAATGDLNKLTLSRKEGDEAYLNVWRKKAYGASINLAKTNTRGGNKRVRQRNETL